MTDFQPPTVPLPPPLHTYTNFSPIPKSIKTATEQVHIVIGVDEAGRGPIIGPMVYSLGYCSTKYSRERLPKLEFADSKKLTDAKRWELMKLICDEDSYSDEIGYGITALTAVDISKEMLRPSQYVINLNEQAHQTTIELIRGLINKLKEEVEVDVIIDGVFIDTVGPPASYKTKLRKYFSVEEVLDIRVEKKADDTYPIVSAASIVAKVTRDWFVKCSSNGKDWGSGYPSDPKTIKFINGDINPWYGWDLNIRYSWGTAKTALEKSKAIEMRWEHELVKKHGFDDVIGMFGSGETNSSRFEVSKDWFI